MARIRDEEELEAVLQESGDNISDVSELWTDSGDDIESDHSSDIIPPSPPEQRRRIFLHRAAQRDVTDSAADRDVTDRDVTDSVVGRDETDRDAAQMESESDDSSSDLDLDWTEVCEETDNPPLPNFHYQELQGPKHKPPPTSAPISYFLLFCTTTFLNLIVTETNRYAQQFLQTNPNLPPSARAKKWKAVTYNEIKGFISVLLNMNIIRRPTIASYWFTSPSQHFPWFSNMFSRNRFQLILKFFHLVDNTNFPRPGEPDYDPCAKVQPIIDHANSVFRHHYIPHQELSIDESLVGTKNHTQLLQYLPNKHHHRWGVKLWMLCDSISHYCLAFSIYKGARTEDDKEEIKKFGLAHTVVMKLMKMGNYLKKGYHIFMDNFFTSIPLASSLYKLQTFITGTIRRNRKFLPKQYQNKFQIGEKKYFRSNSILSLAYREKKSQRNPVILISTNSKAEDQEKTTIRNRQHRISTKPAIIHSYNACMGGIDTSDMMLYTYLDERRTVKYWKKICFNIFSRMVLNSYILYTENILPNTKPMTRLNFTIKIIEALSADWLAEKNSDGAGPSTARDDGDESKYLRKLPGQKQKDCCVCNKRSKHGDGKRRRSKTVCAKCGKGLHGQCFPEHKCHM